VNTGCVKTRGGDLSLSGTPSRTCAATELAFLACIGLCQCSVQAKSIEVPPTATKSSGSAAYGAPRHIAIHSDHSTCQSVHCEKSGGTSIAPGRCDAELCEGDLSAAAIAKLRASAAKTDDCYEVELKEQTQLEGRMTVRLRLAAGREPCDIRIDSGAQLGSEAFRRCVIERLGETEARPEAGCIDVVLPLSFVRQEVEARTDAAQVGGVPATK